MYQGLFYSRFLGDLDRFKQELTDLRNNNLAKGISGFLIITPEKYMIEYLQSENKDNIYVVWKTILESKRHEVVYNTGIFKIRREDSHILGLTVIDLTIQDNLRDRCLNLLINQQIRLIETMKEFLDLSQKAHIDVELLNQFEENMLDKPIYSKTIENRTIEPEEFIKTEIIIRELDKKVTVIEKKLFLGNGQESVLSKISNMDNRIHENDIDISELRKEIEKGKNPITIVDAAKNTSIRSMVTILIVLSLAIGAVERFIIPQLATILTDGISELFTKPLE